MQRAWSATLLMVLIALVVPMGLARPAAAAPTVPAHDTAHGHAVLIGVPGLRWSDIDPQDTPTLWKLADRGAIGNLSVRTVTATTCSTDGWLTVSAGQRASLTSRTHQVCGLPAAPSRDGPGAALQDFDKLRANNAATKYEARLGMRGAGDTGGLVDGYAPTPATTPKKAWSQADLIAVDVDDIARTYVDAGVNSTGTQAHVGAAQRARAAHDADQKISQALAAIPRDSTVLVAGLSSDSGASHLQAGLVSGPNPAGGTYHDTYLTSASTHRPGLATLTDITPTLLDAMHIDASGGDVVGKPWQGSGGRPDSTRDAVADLADAGAAAQVSGTVLAPFFGVLVAVQVLLYLGAALVLRRRPAGRRRRVLATTRVVALAGAAGPVATYLANLVPWWRFDHPLPVVIAAMLIADALVVALALAGPWRRGVLTPVTIVAGSTALTLLLDVITGSHLQVNSPTGYSFVVGGRYYGFGNMAFAVYATSILLATAGVARIVTRRYGRRWAVGLVGAVGVVAVIVNGWPDWGSDFGGVIALVPGFAVVAVMIAGRRVSPVRLGAFCAAGACVVAAIAFADYLRPADQRTHLGTFVQDLMDGQAGPVFARKLGAMLHSLTNVWITLLAICAVLFLFLVLRRPMRWRVSALHLAYEHTPQLRAGLTAVMVTAIVGCLDNDSGIQIPALALTVAVPLALAASVRALQLGPTRRSAPVRTDPVPESSAVPPDVVPEDRS